MKCHAMMEDKRTKGMRECGGQINGMTGLQELENLRKHMAKKHNQPMSVLAANELRASWGE